MIKQIATIDIVPYEKNAKKHPKSQVKQIADSIKAFGFNQPIVVDKHKVIIVGHGRWEAAKLLGLASVPAIIADLTEKEAMAYRLADNRLNESDWDMKIVIEELKLLDPTLVDLTGFSSDLVIEQSEKDDTVPEVAGKPKASRGGVYQLGDHRVMCGDSTDMADVEKLMAGAKADMVFTDPPYNVALWDGDKEQMKREHHRTDGKKIQNDKMDDELFGEFLKKSFQNANSATKAGAVAYIFHPDSAGLIFRKTFIDTGWQVKQCIIWVKNRLVMGRQDYQWQHEPILYGWKKDGTHKFYGDRTFTTIWKEEPSDAKLVKWIRDLMTTDFKNGTTVWRVDRPSRSEEHPTMKPVELITRAIFNSSKSEDIILDLFLGSGSTLIACEKTKRICYGMELDPHYVDVIIKRWEDYTGEKAKKIG